MPYTDAAKSIMLTELASQITHLSLHTAVPSSAGSNEATGGSPAYARKVPTFGTVTAGVLPLSGSLSFDVPAGSYVYVGAWGGSTFLGWGALPATRVYTTQDVLVVSSFAPNLNA